MDILDRLDGAFASTGRVVAKVTLDRLADPTPCSEWDVRGLINHTTGVVAMMSSVAGRRPPDSDLRSADWVGIDPATSYGDATRQNLAAWSQPGALDGSVQMPIGEFPAERAAAINFLDTLVHGWDLARALGMDPTLDPALAAAAMEVAKIVVTDELRVSRGAFAAAIATGSGSPTDQLVAFLGRQP